MRFEITVLDEVYTKKIVEADSRDAIEDGNYEIINEFPGNAGECDQIIAIDEITEGN
jgi:hypothetical protein